MRPSKYGRGISTAVIHGIRYWKFQVNNNRCGHVQKHFKHYEDARSFAITFWQEADYPESHYKDLLDPAFYGQFVEA